MEGVVQHSFFADNVKVFFPFPPYDVQKDYMTTVIEALNKRQNAALESPTGTGKTLSLLCSTMAWLSTTGNKSPVYYTSRTHQQLGQAAKEMKKTAYARQPAVVIGSRAHMCLNKEVKNQHAEHLINRGCRNAIAKNACSYYTNYEQKLEVMDHNNVHDIEDLEKLGHKHQCCPYYASRKIAETRASLIFMPYNYLFDLSIRRSMQLKLENSVIIIDEAHNIESVLKDAASASFSSNCLKLIIESCEKLPERISQALNSEKHGLTRYGYDPKKKISKIVDEFNEKNNGKAEKEKKPNPIEELAEKLTTERLQQVKRCCVWLQEERFEDQLNKTLKIEKVVETFRKASIEYKTSDILITTLDSMTSFWSIAGVMKPEMVARYVTAISNFSHFISLLYPEGCLSVPKQHEHEKMLNKYYVHRFEGIYEQSIRLNIGNLIGWELNLWCLHPAVGLRRVLDASCINGPRSIILTSGTLNPMERLSKDLDVEFKTIKAFQHVISGSQFKVAVVEKSQNNYSLLSTFKNQTDQYFLELGKTLLPLLRVLPHGTLVFFQSYNVMNKVIDYWERKSTIWRDLKNTSRVFREKQKQEQNDFDTDFKNFRLETKTRAVFFVVCRGKLSEGANLQGNECRTVIIAGVPYPSRTDPKVLANKEFHNQTGGGDRWYSEQMRRTLNQTIGRVIRSRDDFGLLLLLGPSFTAFKSSVSKWTQPFYPNHPTPYSQLEDMIKQFFKQNGITVTDSVSENHGAFELNLTTRKNFDPSLFSPFSEESNKSSQGSQKQTAQRRQNAMVEQYRVDKATFDRVKNARKANTEENASSKRPKTTEDFFESIYSETSSQPSQQQTQIQNLNQTQSSNYSILNQFKDANRPAPYKCYICFDKANNPHRTNCPCARVACAKCIEVLNKKTCGKCGTLLTKRNFKQVLFKSAFFAEERQKLIVLPKGDNDSN